MPIFSDYDLWKTDPDRIWGAAPDDPEEDPFIEWATDESERQFDANADRYAGEDVWDFAERALPPADPSSLQKTISKEPT